jgi:hypothetical protein
MDHLQHTFHILRDVIVPKAQHAIAFRFKPPGSLLIRFRDQTFRVLRAIDLDGEVRSQAAKSAT